jgi:hypothetical protein
VRTDGSRGRRRSPNRQRSELEGPGPIRLRNLNSSVVEAEIGLSGVPHQQGWRANPVAKAARTRSLR